MTTHRLRTTLSLVLVLVCFCLCVRRAPAQITPLQPGKRARVIVFVHGLHGDRTSWRAANGTYWPDLMKADPRFAYSDVVVAQYPSPPSGGKSSSLQLSEILWANLRQDHVWEHREIVFVAHSLGGILVEEMLLRHPTDAARVKFIVSYGTPHEGSTVARIASFYDKDPLLNDLSDAGSNIFLSNLESTWRGSPQVNGIHRFCAYETEDTQPEDGWMRYLRPHTRVVSYFSATYGCDVTTPPQAVHADHIHMIKPANRTDAAYDFFRRVYRDNPITEHQTVTREAVVAGLTAACNQENRNPDLHVPVALDSTLHEKVRSAAAFLVDTVDIRDIDPNPPVVTRIGSDGAAHVSYGFKGPGKTVLVCVNTGRATLKVEFTIDQEVPIREPGN